jgi:hypothetical protein
VPPDTDPLARAVAAHRTPTAPQPAVSTYGADHPRPCLPGCSCAHAPQPAATVVRPRPVLLCGRATAAGRPCHLAARHDDGCLPPPPVIVRPHEWARP